MSLVYAKRDTVKEKLREKELKNAHKNSVKPKKVKKQWKLIELDYGIFGEMIQNLNISPDASSIVYPKFRFGKKPKHDL